MVKKSELPKMIICLAVSFFSVTEFIMYHLDSKKNMTQLFSKRTI